MKIIHINLKRRVSTIIFFISVIFVLAVARYCFGIPHAINPWPSSLTIEDLDFISCSSDDISCKCDIFFSNLLEEDYWAKSQLANPSIDRNRIRYNVRNLRLFGKCFLESEGQLPKYLSILEKGLLPFFSRNPPKFMKWDGQEFDLLSTKESTSSTEQESNERFCFWKEVLKSMSGSGIVVSASDQQVTEVMNLLKVLRFLENELPIQIVHKGDLNRDSQKRIIEIGRGVDTPHDKFKQNVWFVDVSNCLHIDHLNKFTRFKNKWLSVLFSSFEEIILMDADTVPLVKPSTLLQNEKYKRSGALFFKDRALSETIWSSEVYLYKSLLPNNLEQRVFGTALQTKRIFENTFFRLNRRHFMESGLVVLNRNHHMTGLLMGCQLNMWDLTSKPVHGDKELFWLGQLLSGQEDFEFANKHAAAIGQVEQSGKIKKVCSTQVAHFDDNGELIWINGGLSTCKKNSACYDYSRFKNLRGNFNSCLSLDSYYQHPIAPKVALITAPKEYSMFQRSLGWKQQPDLGCLGYFWCTHSDSNAENDELIEFNSTFREYFQNLANIWTGVN